MNESIQMSREYPGIPTPSAIRPAILQHVADRERYGFGSIYTAMVAHFCLTPDLESVTFAGDNQLPPNGDNVFYKYCNLACRQLVDKEWLAAEGGFYENKEYRITDLGLEQVTGRGE